MSEQRRFTDTWQGRLSALILAVVWIAAMSMTGSNPYSYVPTLAGLGVVSLLYLSAVITGARTPRLTWVSWVSLAIGCYFLTRCLLTESRIDSWREAPLILGCFIFYYAGICAAQSRRTILMVITLSSAVALNMAFLYLMQQTDVPMEWVGRPTHSIGTEYLRPPGLFSYKNFTSAFLTISGMILAAHCLWTVRNHKWYLLTGLLGLLALYLSSALSSRAVYAAAPIALIVLWGACFVRDVSGERKIGMLTLLSGFIMFTGLGIVVYDLLFGGELVQWVAAIDSHGRFGIWKGVLSLLPDASLWGYGAAGVRWHMISLPYAPESSIINYAHNEYLETWADYGLIGIICVAGIILLHITGAYRAIAGERCSNTRRTLTSAALIGLAAWSACAFADYVWHQFSIAAMTAFCCGLAASPFPQPPPLPGQSPRSVRTESAFGKALLAVGLLIILGISGRMLETLAPVWEAQWDYNRLSQDGGDASGDDRQKLIISLLPVYPDSALTDHLIELPATETSAAIAALKQVLADNPRQLFTVNQLGELYSNGGLYETCENLYRRSYIGDGMMATTPNSWRNFYATNLLRWGEDCFRNGDYGKALSLLQYGSTIVDSYRHDAYPLTYRPTADSWETNIKRMKAESAPWYAFVKACKQDLKILQAQGVTPDDSWQQPTEAGGKPSLYRSIVCPQTP